VVDDDGCAKLIDFGISKLIGWRGCTTASVGTDTYIAPELRNKPSPPETGSWTTKESDVYSFGILAFEVRLQVRVGHRLNRNTAQMFGSILSTDIQRILKPCLTSEPGRRPNMASVLKQLRSIDN
jgi:serine/threonine protein kinase